MRLRNTLWLVKRILVLFKLGIVKWLSIFFRLVTRAK